MGARVAAGLLAGALAALVVLTGWAQAHAERAVEFPSGLGSVPAHRTGGPYLVVCKPDTPQRIAGFPAELRGLNEALFQECQQRGFLHIQQAIDAVPHAGYRILVQPGVYLEEPSLEEARSECLALSRKPILEYEEHWLCPHAHNLVAVLGDDPEDEDRACTTERLCNLQVEGTGQRPGDVVLDGRFQRLNVLRADRADGFYLRNLLVEKSTFNSVYVMEQDGFVLDRVVARYNDEYGFLTFAVDHGLYVDCEAYGNGDAGLYPGSASDLHGARPSVEIARCNSHHNMAGYSGTAGNSVLVHDNDFHHNSVGVVMDSIYPGHPGLPQDAATFRDNRVFSNNENFYENLGGEDAPCGKPVEERDWSGWGTVCPTAPVPVGTGFVVAGGNHNTFAENWVYDQWRQGAMLFTAPAALRGELGPDKQLDTSHFNKYVANRMGQGPDGSAHRNRLDFWWDEGGSGNCWQDNLAPEGLRSDPPLLPDCGAMPLNRPPNPAKTSRLLPCIAYNRTENPHPAGCDWMLGAMPMAGRRPGAPLSMAPPGEEVVVHEAPRASGAAVPGAGGIALLLVAMLALALGARRRGGRA